LPNRERRPPVPAFFAFGLVEPVGTLGGVAVLQRRAISVAHSALH
jgi:hypothetical protein